MFYFNSRYEALKAFPNSIVRKLLKSSLNAGSYVAFNYYPEYELYKNAGFVR